MPVNIESDVFPFHKLDSVGLQEVLKHLTLMDVFELSYTTANVKNVLGETSLPIKAIKISYNSNQPSIEIASGTSTFLWTFGYPEGVEMSDAGEYKVGRFLYKCMKSENGIHTDHFDIEQGFIAVLKYICSVFNCSNAVISELIIDLGVIEDCRTVCSHYTGFKSIERLAIYQSVPNHVAILSFGMNFDWILTNLIPKDMFLGIGVTEHVLTPRLDTFDLLPTPKRFNKILDLDHFGMSESEWITSEDFLNLNPKTAILMNTSLTDEDINLFIKQWLNSTSDKLEWIEVQVQGRNLSKESILADLQVQRDDYHLQNSRCSSIYRKFETSQVIPFIFPLDSKKVSRANNAGAATISIYRNTFFFHVKNDGPITPQLEMFLPERRREAVGIFLNGNGIVANEVEHAGFQFQNQIGPRDEVFPLRQMVQMELERFELRRLRGQPNEV
ncbi:hypothetical protein CRE_25179 [Caenorhabditis remanei]|uniref:Sdz-33 F-box domain-containing protein n=1 Tax=Caenorhabditis remanei TaxID=31234 RepID=E3LTD1_CAERE|nr:hypothetical protein CRE_25179 [Caenorhabditis remanei]